jgi:H+/Cl- antiporter ClcA
MEGTRRTGRWLRWWLLGYAAMIAAVVGAMVWAKQSAMSSSVTEWQAWREAERKEQSGPKIVERRVPQSDEPPALVLMRDYFVVLMLGALVFSSLLFWVIAWFVTGILAQPAKGTGTEPSHSERNEESEIIAEQDPSLRSG